MARDLAPTYRYHRSADQAVAHHDALVAQLGGEETEAPSPPDTAGHGCHF